MDEYRVGCGAFGIYAGTLNSRNQSLWKNKSDVTDEAVCAVAQYLLQENKTMTFKYEGKQYQLRAVPMGRWKTDKHGLERSVCPECGATWEGGPYNYCAKCGAVMERSEQ